MPGLDFDTIKREIPLSEVLDMLGWRPVWQRLPQQRGACLLHTSDRPRSRSFAVNGEGWYCHKCKKGGDVITLWMLLNGLEAAPAAISLCKALSRPIYYLRRRTWLDKTRNGEEER